MQGKLDKTIVETAQLWFSKANTTAPSKPTAQVTSTSIDGNAWRVVVPAYNASYPNYYYCYQWKYSDGTYGWSSVTRDIAMGETQERARTAITNAAAADAKAGNAASVAATAQSTADTANSNASAAVSTANTASNNASTALSTANTAASDASDAKADAATAVSTANTANSNASTALSTANTASTNASTAVSTANTAKSTADTAKATADKNVKSTTQLWYTKANETAPAKPTAKVTSTAVSGNGWRVVVPTYASDYPYYYYCYQYELADGTCTWSDVVYDRATTENQSNSRNAVTGVSTLTTKTNDIQDTVDGHTQSLQSITQTQTSIQKNAVKSTVQLWFTKANTTAPNKPTAHVTTNNAATGNAWNLAVPSYNSAYPNYYYCCEYQYVDGSYGWSAVTRDIATGEAQSTARTAASDASTAKSDASSAVSTANTANTNASNAVSTANTANTNASNAVSTANTAAADASTAKSDAASAVSTANTASANASAAVSTANTAKATADKNVKETVLLWYSKANSTAPSKPTSAVTSTSTSGNAWSVVVPTYSASYPYYFYCYQYKLADGTYAWSSVVYDQAMTEAQSTARAASSSLATYITSNDAAIQSLQNQVDGQIEAWYYSVDPTTSNVPASDWTTDTLKARHEGDLYYNVTSGHSWRWLKNGSTYSWQQIPDSDAAAALAAAQNAQNTANNKRRIFTATPTVPYDKGDLWVNGSVVKYATTARSSGNYTASDWSTTATDDTAANAAQATANKNVRESQQLWFTKANSTAPSKPTSKVTSTSTGGNAWTTKVPTYSASYPHYFYCMQYVAADGTVTWSDVVYDQATTEAQSVARTTSANLSTLQTDYATFKQTTQNFESTIGSTYATKTELKTTDDKIENLEIGGRNLLLGAATQDTSIGNAREYVNETNDTWLGCKVFKSNLAWADIGFRFDIQVVNRGLAKAGDVLTYSIWAKTDDTASRDIYGVWMSAKSGRSHMTGAKIATLTSEWTRYEKQITVTQAMLDSATVGLATRFECNTNCTSGKYIYWAAPKLEKGTKATDWTPAPEDMATDAEVSAIESRVTSAETSITQNRNDIALRAKSSDVYTKTQTDGLISTEVTNRNAAITAKANEITSTVSETYATKSSVNGKADASDVTALAGRVTTAESSITQNAQNIELKVSKDGVISSINQSAESVKIQASKVEIDGTAVFNAISSDVDDAITSKGYQTSSQVNTAITSKGYATTTQAQGYASTAKSEAISAAATDATSKANAAEANAKAAIPSDISELNNDSGFITSADVPTKVSELTNDSGFQTASQVNSTVTSKGYQTSSQVESAITSKGYATTTQAQGYATTAKSEAISAAATDATSKANAAEANAKVYTDAVEIGGRNLFTWPLNGTKWKDEEHALTTYLNRGSFSQFPGSLLFDPSETVGEQYTISFWAKSPNGATQLQIYNNNGTPKYFWFTPKVLTTALGNEWEFFSLTVTNTEYSGGNTPDTNETHWRRIEIYAPAATGVLVKQIKVEKGNKATDWTPAPEDVDAAISAAQTTASNATPKANAVKRTQRIWYRKSSSGAPATPGTASSNWVTKADDGNDAWTKMHIAISSTHKYIYTCEQYEMANGTVGYTSVLLDNTITVIDGGNIITGSVKANSIDAASGTFNTANIPNLSASKITSGDISADRIKANVIGAINSLTAGTIDAARINATQLTIGQSQVTGLTNSLNGKADSSDIPTKVSDLTNDSGYQTSTQVNTAITSKGYATTTQAQGYANDAAKTATNFLTTVDSTGLFVHRANNTNSGVKITDNVDIMRNGTSFANYGETTRIGPASDKHLVIDADSFDFIDDTTNVATLELLNSDPNDVAVNLRLDGGFGDNYLSTYSGRVVHDESSDRTRLSSTLSAHYYGTPMLGDDELNLTSISARSGAYESAVYFQSRDITVHSIPSHSVYNAPLDNFGHLIRSRVDIAWTTINVAANSGGSVTLSWLGGGFIDANYIAIPGRMTGPNGYTKIQFSITARTSTTVTVGYWNDYTAAINGMIIGVIGVDSRYGTVV